MDWTPERVSLLERLRAKGLSHTAVGIALGVGRGAVAGKLWRLAGNTSPRENRSRWHPIDLTKTRPPAPTRWTEAHLTERWADRKKRIPTP